jgi:hypothetical protein
MAPDGAAMSTEIAFGEALIAALEAYAPLTEAVNGIYAVPPGRATPPFVLLGEMAALDWSTKTEAGREIRFAILLREEAERADRLAVLADRAEAAVEAMPRDLPGWQIVSLVLLRSRILRTDGPWTASLDYRARLLAI